MGGYVSNGTMPNTALDPDIEYWDPSSKQHSLAYSNPSVYDTSTYSDRWQSSRYDDIGNKPTITRPESSNTSRQRPRKRKLKEERYHEYRKRPRAEMTQGNLTPLRETSNSGQCCSAAQYGTQLNPIDIECSPEQKSGKRTCIPPSAPRRDSGSYKNYIHEPDPKVNWPIYYAVARGRIPGLYQDWCAAQDQVSGYFGGRHKKFQRQEDAWDFMEGNREVKTVSLFANETIAGSSKTQSAQHECMANQILLSSPPVLDTHTHTYAASEFPWETNPLPTDGASQRLDLDPSDSKYFDSEEFVLEQQQPIGDPQSRHIPAANFVPEPELDLPWETVPLSAESASQQFDLEQFEMDQFILEEQQSMGGSQSRPIPVDNFVPEPEPELSAEQRYVVDLIVEGGHNVFYTGSAGCGKSTILKAFVRKLQGKGKRVKIVAPTNLAALNVDGQTTWAYAGWTPDSLKQPLDKLRAGAHKKEVWKRFEATDVLVIDEISMVENLQFERLNEVMKAGLGGRKSGPFGGVQIIVTGDFCQLSPVKPFAYCIGCGWELIHEVKDGELQHRCENKGCRYDMWPDTDKWAFRSKAWKECKFEHVNLNKIFRQSDQKFKAILEKIRKDGVILPHHATVLLNHSSETENAIKIYALRRDVDRINMENIRRLRSQSHVYHCLDNFEWREHHQGDDSLKKYKMPGTNGSNTLHNLKEHRYEACVELKEGMRVVLQSNLQPDRGLVNGAQGTIVGFETFDPKKLPIVASNKPGAMDERNRCLRGPHAEYAQYQIDAYAKDNQRPLWPIVEFDNNTTRTIYADCAYSELGNEEKRTQEGQPRQEPSLLSRTQIPLVAGYAITVHKSQGMTLNRVIVDLRAAFEASQIYVALSRARSLKGLKVLGLPQKNLGGANKQVKEFFETYLTPKKSLSEAAQPSSQVAPWQQSSPPPPQPSLYLEKT